MNRPEVRNALDQVRITEIAAALWTLERDRDARGIVPRGAGEKAFCAGADLKGVREHGTTLEARDSFSRLARILGAMGH